jgi:hypothetical protein
MARSEAEITGDIHRLLFKSKVGGKTLPQLLEELRRECPTVVVFSGQIEKILRQAERQDQLHKPRSKRANLTVMEKLDLRALVTRAELDYQAGKRSPNDREIAEIFNKSHSKKIKPSRVGYWVQKEGWTKEGSIDEFKKAHGAFLSTVSFNEETDTCSKNSSNRGVCEKTS